jgi:predicted nucleic acid-binding protein
MKTTVEIPDSLLQQARHLAAQENTTVKALVQEGHRRLLAERNAGKPFKLRKISFRGNGLQPQMAGAAWQQIRDAAYQGRGARSPSIPTSLTAGRVAGPQVHDARVAALCRLHGVQELWTADRDFGRFPGLKVRNPLFR